MKITRREFNKRAGTGLLVAATGGSAVFLDGCNLFTDILRWAPLGLAAFNGIVTMLETFGILGDPLFIPIIAAVRVAFSDLIQDIQLYQAIVPPPSGVIAEIQAVLALIANNIKNLVGQISTGFGPIINLIIGLVQLILGTISGFQNQLPPAPGQPRMTTVSDSFKFRVGRNPEIRYMPLKLTTAQFRSKWNAICYSQGHPEMEL